MNHEDVHSGCFPTSPAKKHLILRLRLEKGRKQNETSMNNVGERKENEICEMQRKGEHENKSDRPKFSLAQCLQQWP